MRGAFLADLTWIEAEERFSRDPNGKGTYSPTGAWGDPTLASRAKGERIVEAFFRGLVGDVVGLMSRPRGSAGP